MSIEKPYLRTQIAIRVLVWWPFCDFFFGILIPTLVRLHVARGRWRNAKNRKWCFLMKMCVFLM